MNEEQTSVNRRRFLRDTSTFSLGAAAVPIQALAAPFPATTDPRQQVDDPVCCDRTYATVADAIKSPPERIAYVPGIYAGTGIEQPDYLATIDLEPGSATYGQVIHRLPMPFVGDELHHFGWNTCSSCHGTPNGSRRFLVLPGIASSRIYIIDTQDEKQPRLHKVISPEVVRQKTGLSAPHTVHCLATGEVMISMLGNANGDGPGGFILLDENFEVKGRWEQDAKGMNFNYDFWYQPRHNVMVSSEWGAPNTVAQGFNPADVAANKYGKHLHFWDWEKRSLVQSIDLGEEGRIPLEVRFLHDPASDQGFVGAALSSKIWRWWRQENRWHAEPVISVESLVVDGWSFPVPGLITDLVVSLDDRFLYFSNWLHGDIRQYDISDPSKPKLTGQLFLGGVLGRAPTVHGKKLSGGPQMLQLSFDGQRLYLTNSLYSPWDNQFYPDIKENGSYMLKIKCNTERGGLEIDDSFFVDFGNEPFGAARAHEIRFSTGDSTSDVWT